MHTEQRKFQQPKCLHVITCLLFSCLLLVSEWQLALATPFIMPTATTSTLTSTAASASVGAAAAAAAATRRLRNYEKSNGRDIRVLGGDGAEEGGEGGGADIIHLSRADGTESIRGAGSNSSPCEHKTLSELIKTSPVILKALGAHIFNHDDDEDLRILHNSNDALLLKWQNEQNKVLASLNRAQRIQKFASSSSSAATKNAATISEHQDKQKQQQTFSDAATNRAAMLASVNADAILITLTPETIYKGASLLKMPSSSGEQTTAHKTSTSGSSNNNNVPNSSTNTNTFDSNSGNSANSGTNSGYTSGTINSSEASYLYEGQLNATVQPLSCFDENLLKMLPSDLIIFGKLSTLEEQQGHKDDLLRDLHDYTISSSSSSSSLSSSLLLQHQQKQSAKDVLKISINGLHRWSPQFENYIWKHLGWDDWSDFTVCSVACGKGVQQRFRRCLLDNPMVNLNMNFNNNDDQNDDDVVVEMDVGSDVIEEVELEVDEDEDSDSINVDDDLNEQHNTIDEDTRKSSNEVIENKIYNNHGEKQEMLKTISTPTKNFQRHPNNTGNVLSKMDTSIMGNMLHFVTTAQTEISNENSTAEEPIVMRLFEGHFNNTFSEKALSGPGVVASTSLKAKKNTKQLNKQQQQKQQRLKVKHKKHKSAKLFSTMFCEGYNIEQRNCNSFECSDDINDLLKFYRKYPTNDETNTASTQMMTIMDLNTIAAASSSSPSSSSSASSSYSTQSDATAGSLFSSYTINSETDGTETNNQNINTFFTTPINMGFVQNWHNSLNFTIMLTLRVKNDSYTTATIFSIRNSTHNLYLESCKDGLRLYLERDKTTEMLPIKFNLYDYRWHQVAISIQNGDFISIHVDCSWTNSFVVSKRLFSLPVTADVEIARGFNGELQQLLILPEHQERFQCSEKRTSINEVKRYIIDTFIDDYAN